MKREHEARACSTGVRDDQAGHARARRRRGATSAAGARRRSSAGSRRPGTRPSRRSRRRTSDDRRRVEDRRQRRREPFNDESTRRVDRDAPVGEGAEVLPRRAPRRKRRASATYAQNDQRQRPGGMRPSGKRTIGSGNSRSSGTQAGARKTASRPSGRPWWPAVDEHRVVRGVDAQEHGERERQQDPADRIPGLAPRDE